MNPLLPPRPFLDAIVTRVLVLWLFLHAASGLGSAAVGMGTPFPQSLIGPPLGTLWIIAVIVLVVRVEMWRRSEIIFLANLGHSFFRIALVIIAEFLLLETGLRVAVG